MIVIPSTGRLAIVTELVDVGNFLAGALVGLYQNDFVPSKDMVLGDFVPCDFDGYAAKPAVTWGAPYIDPLGNGQVVGNIHEWLSTGGVVTNTVYGYFVKVGAALLLAERFDNPIPITGPSQAVIVLPRFSFGQ